MWTFRQSTGELFHNDAFSAVAYSGHGIGRDNCDMQNIPNVGPLPKGYYDISAPHDSATHGPYVLRLEPYPTNDMFGRSGFLIHGDAIADAGNASHGCIVAARVIRQRIWESGDHLLKVIA